MEDRAGDPKPPAHVGIIMDGNGRWAVEHGSPRTEGHTEGLKAAKEVVRAALDLGVKALSLYTFSTENWTRARAEVSFLMSLVGKNLRRELDFYREHSIRVVHSGRREDLPPAILKELDSVGRATAAFGGLTVNLAFNYGGRDEIVRAVNRWIGQRGASGETGPITESDLSACLDQPALGEPDLIIRTGRERRISNFLLWQGAYAEMIFSDKLWPDFGREDLLDAIAEYGRRKRRFGAEQ